ncbi:MAG: YihY family inner membrane protein [Nitrospinae bacterium]|nr:YihY family inner membrane protein [Nitrospinota bacterium]
MANINITAESAVARIVRAARTGFFLLLETWRLFLRNNQFETAAALAYYGFFAMLPLLLLAMLMLGNYIISSREAMAGIDALTRQIFPEFSKVIIKEVHSLSHSAKKWGLLGLITVFWAAMPLTGGLRAAFKEIFRVERRVSFLRGLLFDAAAVGIILALFVALTVSNIGYSVMQARFLNSVPAAYRISYAIGPFFLILVFLAIFYALFAPRIPARHLAAGTLITATAWIGMKELFTVFITVNPAYGVAFGSLKAVFIVIAWVYVSFIVILFGAELMAALGMREALLLKEIFASPARFRRREKLLHKYIQSIAEGEVICREGERGTSMFYLLEGEVEITREGAPRRRLGPKEFFGEIAMLLGGDRAATVTAAAQCRVIEISRDNFNKINELDSSISATLLRQMAVRLKSHERY